MYLSSDELQHHLAQIEAYFRVEYSLLLQQTSELAAKTIVLAGDDAPGRLETLKDVGFGQLGRIDNINFDRILWLLLAISLLGFLVLFFWQSLRSAQSSLEPSLMARIAFVTSLATLTGAIFGSRRSLANRPTTPWSAYLMAGTIAIVLFMAVHGSAYLLENVSDELQQPSAAAASAPVPAPATAPAPAATLTQEANAKPRFQQPGFKSILPFAASPFFLAIAICWLARQPYWPRPSFVPARMWERVIDALIIGGVMLFAQATAIALHHAFGTEIAVMMQKRMVELGTTNPFWPLMRSPFLPIGLLIGAIVVRDVRVAAHAQLTDKQALDEYMRNERAGEPAVMSTGRSGPPPAGADGRPADSVGSAMFGASRALSTAG